ncbi:MAG TPA: hypothetical protein VHN74_03235, partial [Candidatus Angelobacter sp.]|nr:hypothetical protein [Candidatus Angelobacter sp.]
MKVFLSYAWKATVLTTLVALLVALPPRSKAQVTRQITSSGSTQPAAAPAGVPGLQNPEIDAALAGSDDDEDLGIDLQGNVSGRTSINRTIAPGPGQGQTVNGRTQAKSNPEVVTSFD